MDPIFRRKLHEEFEPAMTVVDQETNCEVYDATGLLVYRVSSDEDLTLVKELERTVARRLRERGVITPKLVDDVADYLKIPPETFPRRQSDQIEGYVPIREEDI